ncbi:MAG: hypothetical protein Q4G58_01510 [bacterium]|nr:hypothetical protein [bacterium]
MNIFVDSLDYEDIDFTVYYNQDDEPEEIDEMEDEEIKNHIIELERQIKMLPEHYNADIWEEYKRVFKQELKDRAL